MQLYLHPLLKALFSPTQPLFDQLMALQGESVRAQKGRTTQRVMLNGKAYFIKQHHGVGWKEIMKNLLQGRWPVLTAAPEWRAIEQLQALGVRVPTVVGYGKRGVCPAHLQSFILMEALAPTVSLEELCQTWKASPPPAAFKWQLLQQVARTARLMHQQGINHRDFYLCHFLLDTRTMTSPQLYLIDLHRAQCRDVVPMRWLVKDLAGLYFSSRHIGLTRRDYYRFMQAYCERPWRQVLSTERALWAQVVERGERQYRAHHGQ